MADDTVVVPLRKVIFDVVLLQLVGWPILFLFLWGNPFQRGFFCDDESIRHPFHESTVPSWTLYITGFGLNIITVHPVFLAMRKVIRRAFEANEKSEKAKKRKNRKIIGLKQAKKITMLLTEILNPPNGKNTFYFLGRRIPYWVYNAYCAIGIFAFGAACSQLTTDVMKYTIGRLRPHFIAVCMPDVNCSLARNQFIYHTGFMCNNQWAVSKRLMKEMRLSFPSGHSSFSMYTMVYFAIYLHKRMTWDGSKLLRHTLQFLAILSSVFTAMTRVSDYKHHWSDVLAGLAIGTFIASIVARHFSTLFSSNPSNNDSPEHSELNGHSNNRATAVGV